MENNPKKVGSAGFDQAPPRGQDSARAAAHKGDRLM